MERREIEGAEDGAGLHVGVAVATFNAVITDGLLAGALERLEELGVEQVTVAKVPGSLEVPLVAQALAQAGCDAIVAIGAVIEGETDHYHHVATQASAGIRQVALTTGVPVANAVLTVRDLAHARDRSLPGPGNKGREAADAAVRTIRTLEALRGGRAASAAGS